MSLTAGLYALCAAVYLSIAAIIGWRSRRTVPLLLAACCLVTSGWAVAALLQGAETAGGVMGAPDLVRALAWFGFIYYLYGLAGYGRVAHEIGFAVAGLLAAGAGVVGLVAWPGEAGSLFSLGILGRIGLAIAELLLIENLYLNLPEQSRWHISVPAVLLGGLACFDIVLCADAVLFHASSLGLLNARTLGMVIIAPLLLIAASRGRRWTGRVRLSRTAVFHSATLMLSGGVLLALAVAGEVFRHLGETWAWLAEASLAFTALIAIGLMLTSASARSRVHRMFVDHFFAERYDYRRQWLSCIGTLSGGDGDVQSALPTRAIRAIANVVDSPSGALLLRDAGFGAFEWAGSWNMPAIAAVPPDHPAAAAIMADRRILRLDTPEDGELCQAPIDGLGPLWLAVPLLERGEVTGLVFVAPPRAPFLLEQEVFDLLRTVAQEVSTYIAEQRATQTLLQTRHLHDYSKRFAFVAHDIKNVSSQLALLLANARIHIANPEFQRDMIETVESSVRKITVLLERLERPEVDRAPAALAPLARIEALVGTYRRVRKANLHLEHDGSTGTVAMGADAFEMAVTHVLNNAVEASAGGLVTVRVRHEVRQVVIDVIDTGPGMSAEFVRDELFRPFSTFKAGGSGIGAFQSRELMREAGGDVVVMQGTGGTTIRLLIPRTDVPVSAAAALEPAEMVPVGGGVR